MHEIKLLWLVRMDLSRIKHLFPKWTEINKLDQRENGHVCIYIQMTIFGKKVCCKRVTEGGNICIPNASKFDFKFE